jgi:transcriptional regulator with XRE-family HTH domain
MPKGETGTGGRRPEWSTAHGMLLRRLRQERGWSQQELARQAGHGVTQQDVSGWETDAASPSAPKFAALCTALGHSPQDFVAQAEGIAGALDAPVPPARKGEGEEEAGMAADPRPGAGRLAPYAVRDRPRGGTAAGQAARGPTLAAAGGNRAPAGGGGQLPAPEQLLAMLQEALRIVRDQTEACLAQARAVERSAAAAQEAAALAREAAGAAREAARWLAARDAERPGPPAE